MVAFAEAGRDGTRMIAFPQATTPGRSTAVLFRVEPGAGALPASGSAGLWRLDQGEPSGSSAEMLRAPSQVAWEQGWRVLPHLSAGRYILRIGTSDPGAVPPLDLTLRIPPNPPPVTYIGSFRVVCAAPAQSCQIMAGAAEPAEAAALVALTGPALAPPVTALAGPYPPSLGALGLARPTAPRIRVDPRLWVAAIDWNAVIREGGGQVPPALGPQSRIEGGGETEMVLTSSVPGAIGGTIGGAGNAGGAAGAVVVLGALAIVGTVALIALIAQAIAKDQRNRKDAAE
ncbi:MAG: hypothetical protein MUF65_03100, partial [Rubritepida sp.]|nr:hypothetical protein [Rubritepida sp.]